MNALPLLLGFGALALLLLFGLTLLCQFLWPHIVRKCHCSWCWKALHLTRFYPRQWSSTICRYHDHRMCARSAARRQARLKAQGALTTQERR